jgi:cyclase
MEEADEILLLDITRESSEASQMAFHDTVRQFAEQLFLPLSVGGHLSSAAGAHAAFRELGADKVVINTHAFHHPEFITEIAHKYGSQAVCVSIDVKDWHVWIDRGSEDTGVHVLEWAREATARGAGELLIMDMDRDGSLEGYNLELTRAVADAVSVPVVAVGGCGNPGHMIEVIQEGHATACATQCIFHFSRLGVINLKKGLATGGVPVRN